MARVRKLGRRVLRAARRAARRAGRGGFGGVPSTSWLTPGRRAQAMGALERAIAANRANPFNESLRRRNPRTGRFDFDPVHEGDKGWPSTGGGGGARRAIAAAPGPGVAGQGPTSPTERALAQLQKQYPALGSPASSFFDPLALDRVETDPLTGQPRFRVDQRGRAVVRAALAQPLAGARGAERPNGFPNHFAANRYLQSTADKYKGAGVTDHRQLEMGRDMGHYRTPRQQVTINRYVEDDELRTSVNDALEREGSAPEAPGSAATTYARRSASQGGSIKATPGRSAVRRRASDNAALYLRPGVEPGSKEAEDPDNWLPVPEEQIKHLDERMAKESLRDAMVLSWTTSPEKSFGVSSPEDIASVPTIWNGRYVSLGRSFVHTRAGGLVFDSQLQDSVEGPYVKWVMFAPRGTKAVVPGGEFDKDKMEWDDKASSVILNRDTTARIVGITQDSAGNLTVSAVAHPSREGIEAPMGLGRIKRRGDRELRRRGEVVRPPRNSRRATEAQRRAMEQIRGSSLTKGREAMFRNLLQPGRTMTAPERQRLAQLITDDDPHLRTLMGRTTLENATPESAFKAMHDWDARDQARRAKELKRIRSRAKLTTPAERLAAAEEPEPREPTRGVLPEPTAEVVKAEVPALTKADRESPVYKGWEATRGEGKSLVWLTDLRKSAALKGLTRDQQDKAILKLYRAGKVQLSAPTSSAPLTSRDRRDALTVNGQDVHLLTFVGGEGGKARTIVSLSPAEIARNVAAQRGPRSVRRPATGKELARVTPPGKGPKKLPTHAGPGNYVEMKDEQGRTRIGRIRSIDDNNLMTVTWMQAPGAKGEPSKTVSAVDPATKGFKFGTRFVRDGEAYHVAGPPSQTERQRMRAVLRRSGREEFPVDLVEWRRWARERNLSLPPEFEKWEPAARVLWASGFGDVVGNDRAAELITTHGAAAAIKAPSTELGKLAVPDITHAGVTRAPRAGDTVIATLGGPKREVGGDLAQEILRAHFLGVNGEGGRFQKLRIATVKDPITGKQVAKVAVIKSFRDGVMKVVWPDGEEKDIRLIPAGVSWKDYRETKEWAEVARRFRFEGQDDRKKRIGALAALNDARRRLEAARPGHKLTPQESALTEDMRRLVADPDKLDQLPKLIAGETDAVERLIARSPERLMSQGSTAPGSFRAELRDLARRVAAGETITENNAITKELARKLRATVRPKLPEGTTFKEAVETGRSAGPARAREVAAELEMLGRRARVNWAHVADLLEEIGVDLTERRARGKAAEKGLTRAQKMSLTAESAIADPAAYLAAMREAGPGAWDDMLQLKTKKPQYVALLSTLDPERNLTGSRLAATSIVSMKNDIKRLLAAERGAPLDVTPPVKTGGRVVGARPIKAAAQAVPEAPAKPPVKAAGKPAKPPVKAQPEAPAAKPPVKAAAVAVKPPTQYEQDTFGDNAAELADYQALATGAKAAYRVRRRNGWTHQEALHPETRVKPTKAAPAKVAEAPVGRAVPPTPPAGRPVRTVRAQALEAAAPEAAVPPAKRTVRAAPAGSLKSWAESQSLSNRRDLDAKARELGITGPTKYLVDPLRQMVKDRMEGVEAPAAEAPVAKAVKKAAEAVPVAKVAKAAPGKKIAKAAAKAAPAVKVAPAKVAVKKAAAAAADAEITRWAREANLPTTLKGWQEWAETNHLKFPAKLPTWDVATRRRWAFEQMTAASAMFLPRSTTDIVREVRGNEWRKLLATQSLASQEGGIATIGHMATAEGSDALEAARVAFTKGGNRSAVAKGLQTAARRLEQQVVRGTSGTLLARRPTQRKKRYYSRDLARYQFLTATPTKLSAQDARRYAEIMRLVGAHRLEEGYKLPEREAKDLDRIARQLRNVPRESTVVDVMHLRQIADSIREGTDDRTAIKHLARRDAAFLHTTVQNLRGLNKTAAKVADVVPHVAEPEATELAVPARRAVRIGTVMDAPVGAIDKLKSADDVQIGKLLAARTLRKGHLLGIARELGLPEYQRDVITPEVLGRTMDRIRTDITGHLRPGAAIQAPAGTASRTELPSTGKTVRVHKPTAVGTSGAGTVKGVKQAVRASDRASTQLAKELAEVDTTPGGIVKRLREADNADQVLTDATAGVRAKIPVLRDIAGELGIRKSGTIADLRGRILEAVKPGAVPAKRVVRAPAVKTAVKAAERVVPEAKPRVVKKPGKVVPAAVTEAEAAPPRVEGRNLVAQLGTKELADLPRAQQMREILKAQGFDAPAHATDKAGVDRVIDAGGIELFRGGTPERAKALISGDLSDAAASMGTGSFGRGIYAGGRDVAEMHAVDKGLTRMALQPGAKIIKMEDLDATRSRLSPTWDIDQKVLYSNNGALAAALGYDAIAYGATPDEPLVNRNFIVLNRSALSVDQTPALSTADIKKLQPRALREYAESQGVDTAGMKKPEIIAALRAQRLAPAAPTKAVRKVAKKAVPAVSEAEAPAPAKAVRKVAAKKVAVAPEALEIAAPPTKAVKRATKAPAKLPPIPEITHTQPLADRVKDVRQRIKEFGVPLSQSEIDQVADLSAIERGMYFVFRQPSVVGGKPNTTHKYALTIARRGRVIGFAPSPGMPGEAPTPRVLQTRLLPRHPSTTAAIDPKTGALFGSFGSFTDLSGALTGESVPDGIPVRELDIEGDILVKRGTLWRHGGVSYLAEIPAESTGAGARRWQQEMEQKRANLPPEVRHLVTSYAFIDGPSPRNALLRQTTGDPNAESMMESYQAGPIVMWDGGKEYIPLTEIERNLKHSHEVGHQFHYALGILDRVPDLHNPHVVSYLAAVRHAPAVNPNWKSITFFSHHGISVGTGSFAKVYEVKIKDPTLGFQEGLVPDASTWYGSLTLPESIAEDFAIYNQGVIGWAKRVDGGPQEPVFFRDLYPERAQWFDSYMPSVLDRQKTEFAQASLGKTKVPTTGGWGRATPAPLPKKTTARGVARVAPSPVVAQAMAPQRRVAPPRGITREQEAELLGWAKDNNLFNRTALNAKARELGVHTSPSTARTAELRQAVRAAMEGAPTKPPVKATPIKAVKKAVPAKKVTPPPVKAVPTKAAPAKVTPVKATVKPKVVKGAQGVKSAPKENVRTPEEQTLAAQRGYDITSSRASAADIAKAAQLDQNPDERPILRTDKTFRGFEEGRGLTFLPEPIQKTGTIVVEPSDYNTTLTDAQLPASWGKGATETMRGTWVRVPEPGERGKIYGSAFLEWLDTHERVPGTSNKWIKTAPVEAYQIRPGETHPPVQSFAPSAEGVKEAEAKVPAPGSWVVRQKNGEVQVITDRVFKRSYQHEQPLPAIGAAQFADLNDAEKNVLSTITRLSTAGVDAKAPGNKWIRPGIYQLDKAAARRLADRGLLEQRKLRGSPEEFRAIETTRGRQQQQLSQINRAMDEIADVITSFGPAEGIARRARADELARQPLKGVRRARARARGLERRAGAPNMRLVYRRALAEFMRSSADTSELEARDEALFAVEQILTGGGGIGGTTEDIVVQPGLGPINVGRLRRAFGGELLNPNEQRALLTAIREVRNKRGNVAEKLASMIPVRERPGRRAEISRLRGMRATEEPLSPEQEQTLAAGERRLAAIDASRVARIKRARAQRWADEGWPPASDDQMKAVTQALENDALPRRIVHDVRGRLLNDEPPARIAKELRATEAISEAGPPRTPPTKDTVDRYLGALSRANDARMVARAIEKALGRRSVGTDPKRVAKDIARARAIGATGALRRPTDAIAKNDTVYLGRRQGYGRVVRLTPKNYIVELDKTNEEIKVPRDAAVLVRHGHPSLDVETVKKALSHSDRTQHTSDLAITSFVDQADADLKKAFNERLKSIRRGEATGKSITEPEAERITRIGGGPLKPRVTRELRAPKLTTAEEDGDVVSVARKGSDKVIQAQVIREVPRLGTRKIYEAQEYAPIGQLPESNRPFFVRQVGNTKFELIPRGSAQERRLLTAIKAQEAEAARPVAPERPLPPGTTRVIRGGKPQLQHTPDPAKAALAKRIAEKIDTEMARDAVASYERGEVAGGSLEELMLLAALRNGVPNHLFEKLVGHKDYHDFIRADRRNAIAQGIPFTPGRVTGAAPTPRPVVKKAAAAAVPEEPTELTRPRTTTLADDVSAGRAARILVAQREDGTWGPTTKKTGATPITVTAVSTLPGRGRRRIVTGVDDQGNQIATRDVPGHQTWTRAPEVAKAPGRKVARKAAAAVAPEAPAPKKAAVKRAVKAATPEVPAAAEAPAARKPGARRTTTFNPYREYQAGGEEGLRRSLTAFTPEGLKDIVAHWGMDPTGAAMRWRKRDRVLDLIVGRVRDRSVKGRVFGAPEVPESRETPARIARAGTTLIKEDVPLKPYNRDDNMRMHGDSLTMGLVHAYEAAGRNGSANRMLELRHRSTTDGPDGITPQQTVDELRDFLAQEHDPAMRRRIERAIEGIDSPMTPMPDLPEHTPPLARKLIEDLHAIPYARKSDGDRAGAGSVQGASLVARLADVYRDIAAGRRGPGGVRPHEAIRRVLRDHVHEINEASFRIWKLADRLDTTSGGPGGGRLPSELDKELRLWERGALPATPLREVARPASPEPSKPTITRAAGPRTNAETRAEGEQALRSLREMGPGGPRLTTVPEPGERVPVPVKAAGRVVRAPKAVAEGPEDTVRRLRALDTSDSNAATAQGQEILNGITSRSQLVEIAKVAKVEHGPRATREILREGILRQTVTRRAEHAAYLRRAKPAQLELPAEEAAPVKAARPTVTRAAAKKTLEQFDQVDFVRRFRDAPSPEAASKLLDTELADHKSQVRALETIAVQMDMPFRGKQNISRMKEALLAARTEAPVKAQAELPGRRVKAQSTAGIDARVAALVAREDAGKPLNAVAFYGARSTEPGIGPHVLSQHYPAPFTLGDTTYPTAEHYMMAEKARLFGDEATRQKILAAPTPAAAKRLGRQVAGFKQAEWDAASHDIVVRGNVAKFTQNPELGAYLRSTGTKVLVEASPTDREWGIGLGVKDTDHLIPSRWRGRNKLGFALMDARDQLRAQQRGVKAIKAAVKAAPAAPTETAPPAKAVVKAVPRKAVLPQVRSATPRAVTRSPETQARDNLVAQAHTLLRGLSEAQLEASNRRIDSPPAKPVGKALQRIDSRVREARRLMRGLGLSQDEITQSLERINAAALAAPQRGMASLRSKHVDGGPLAARSVRTGDFVRWMGDWHRVSYVKNLDYRVLIKFADGAPELDSGPVEAVEVVKGTRPGKIRGFLNEVRGITAPGAVAETRAAHVDGAQMRAYLVKPGDQVRFMGGWHEVERNKRFDLGSRIFFKDGTETLDTGRYNAVEVRKGVPQEVTAVADRTPVRPRVVRGATPASAVTPAVVEPPAARDVEGARFLRVTALAQLRDEIGTRRPEMADLQTYREGLRTDLAKMPDDVKDQLATDLRSLIKQRRRLRPTKLNKADLQQENEFTNEARTLIRQITGQVEIPTGEQPIVTARTIENVPTLEEMGTMPLGQLRAFAPELGPRASRGAIIDALTTDAPIDAHVTYTPGLEQLAEIVRKGELTNEREIKATGIGRVAAFTAPDGTRVIKKTYRSSPAWNIDAKTQADSDQLTARYAHAMGLTDVPDVYRASERTVYMPYVRGTVMSKATPEQVDAAVSSDEGRTAHLIDIVTGQLDRNRGNAWVRKGKPVPFDHSLGFVRSRTVNGEVMPPPLHQDDPFRTHWKAVKSKFRNGDSLEKDVWADPVPFSREELIQGRRALRSIRTDFDRLGRRDWYDIGQGRIDAMLRRVAPESELGEGNVSGEDIKLSRALGGTAKEEAEKLSGVATEAAPEPVRVRKVARKAAKAAPPAPPVVMPAMAPGAKKAEGAFTKDAESPLSGPSRRVRFVGNRIGISVHDLARRHSLNVDSRDADVVQKHLDNGESPVDVAAGLRQVANDGLDDLRDRHRPYLRGEANYDEDELRQFEREQNRLADLMRLADLLEREKRTNKTDESDERLGKTRARGVEEPGKEVVPYGRRREDETPLVSERTLRAAIHKAVPNRDRDRRRRGGGDKGAGLLRHLGNGGGMNGLDGFGGVPHLPGTGTGPGDGAGGTGRTPRKAISKGLRAADGAAGLPQIDDVGSLPTPQAKVTYPTHGPGLYPRPTSAIWEGRGIVPTVPTSQIRRPQISRAPIPSAVPGGGVLPVSERSGLPLSPDLEGLLDTLQYDNAATMAGQLARGTRTAEDINALARRAGVADELNGVRGRGARLRRLARALNQQYGSSAPLGSGDLLPDNAVPALPGRRITRAGGATGPRAALTPEAQALATQEQQLAEARRRLARLGGPTGRSGYQSAAADEAADNVAALEDAVAATRGRINPDPGFWRRRDLQGQLEDSGLSPLDARRAIGEVPEQTGIATSLPAEAAGRSVRLRRPRAEDVPVTDTLELPPVEPAPIARTFLAPVRRHPGATAGVQLNRLGRDDLKPLGAESVMAAFQRGQVGQNEAADRLSELAEEARRTGSRAPEPQAAVFRAEGRRLQSMAQRVRSGGGLLPTEPIPDGQGGGGGLVYLSASDIRDVLTRLESADQALAYLQGLHISSAGLRVLATSLGVEAPDAVTDQDLLVEIAQSVKG